jgi:arsenate reductase
MNNFTIYHNPRCSKSRQTLKLIEEKGIEPEIILYLEKPPTVSVLSKILDYLQMKPRDLLRKGEDEYKTFNLKDITLDNSIILKIMSENPKLIERPIVLSGDRAIIGRPPENVLELIK